MERYLENYGNASQEITHSQGRLISYLCENSDRIIFQKDIENHFNTRRSTVSVTLTALEKSGYIKRVSVNTDARLKRIIATEKAMRLHLAICEEFDKFDIALVEGIDKEDVETFLRVISAIDNNIKNNEERAEKLNAENLG